jgi:hypothetical protein
MSQQTIQHRIAAVRKSWTYGDRLKRVVAAQQRCQRLIEQLGLASAPRELAYAQHPAQNYRNRRSG